MEAAGTAESKAAGGPAASPYPAQYENLAASEKQAADAPPGPPARRCSSLQRRANLMDTVSQRRRKSSKEPAEDTTYICESSSTGGESSTPMKSPAEDTTTICESSSVTGGESSTPIKSRLQRFESNISSQDQALLMPGGHVRSSLSNRGAKEAARPTTSPAGAQGEVKVESASPLKDNLFVRHDSIKHKMKADRALVAQQREQVKRVATPPVVDIGISADDRRRALFSVYLAVVIDWMGVSLTQPIMPFYITDVLGGPSWSVGLLYAIFAMVQIVGTPLLGWASDRYGRRPVMLISLAGTSCGYCLSALAFDYRLLLAARGLQGFFSSSLSVANAYIADIFPQEERPGLMANLRGLGSATYIVCPTAGSLLSLVSMRAPYLAGACTSAIACLIALFWMPSSPHQFAPALAANAAHAPSDGKSSGGGGDSAPFPWRKVGVLGLLNVLLSFAVAAAMFGVALYLKARLGWEQGHVAAIMTTSSVLGLAFQFGGFNWLQQRIGLLSVGALAGAALAVAYGLLTLVTEPSPSGIALVCVVTLLQGAGIAMSMAVPSPLLAQYATPPTMGRVMAFATTTGTVGRVVAPVTLGLLFGISPAAPLLLTAVCCVFGSVGYYAVQIVEWREDAEERPEDGAYVAVVTEG